MKASKASAAGNSVVQAVEQACAIFGVRCYRQQSRAVTVVGVGGRPRPMFMGQWRDRNGTLHYAGIADLLLTPNIRWESGFVECVTALWVECKAGTGRLTDEQKAFKEDVEEAGAYYIECHDSADQVVQWFLDHGVQRR